MGVTPDRPKKFVHIVRIGQEVWNLTGQARNVYRVYKSSGRWVQAQVDPDPELPYKHKGLVVRKKTWLNPRLRS